MESKYDSSMSPERRRRRSRKSSRKSSSSSSSSSSRRRKNVWQESCSGQHEGTKEEAFPHPPMTPQEESEIRAFSPVESPALYEGKLSPIEYGCRAGQETTLELSMEDESQDEIDDFEVIHLPEDDDLIEVKSDGRVSPYDEEVEERSKSPQPEETPEVAGSIINDDDGDDDDNWDAQEPKRKSRKMDSRHEDEQQLPRRKIKKETPQSERNKVREIVSPVKPHRPLTSAGFTRCVVERSSRGLMGLATYTMYLQDSNWKKMQPVLVAKKEFKSKTPYYSIFDLTKGPSGARLTKKSGNYLGKLRTSFGGSECVLYGSEAIPSQHLACRFSREKQGIVSKINNNTDPRAMRVLVPKVGLNACGRVSVNDVAKQGENIMDLLRSITDFRAQQFLTDHSGGQRSMSKARHYSDETKSGETDKTGSYIVLGNKLPKFVRGSYRLNFGGRVTEPSVKNFQLVDTADMIDEDMDVAVADMRPVMMQFGRIGNDTFHMDFRESLTPFQAFGIAIAQFNFTF